MSETATDPATQDTPQVEKLYGGKYKTPEELEAAYQESVKRQSQLDEENDRMQRYIALMDQPAQSQPQPVETNGNGIDNDAPLTRAELQAELDNRERATRQNADIEQTFFSANPDLAGQKDLVLLHTMKLKNEMGGRSMSLPKVMEEVAKRVRTQIETIRKGNGAPPRVEGGSSGERLQSDKGQPSSQSEEERLQDFVKEKKAQRVKQLTRG